MVGRWEKTRCGHAKPRGSPTAHATQQIGFWWDGMQVKIAMLRAQALRIDAVALSRVPHSRKSARPNPCENSSSDPRMQTPKKSVSLDRTRIDRESGHNGRVADSRSLYVVHTNEYTPSPHSVTEKKNPERHQSRWSSDPSPSPLCIPQPRWQAATVCLACMSGFGLRWWTSLDGYPGSVEGGGGRWSAVANFRLSDGFLGNSQGEESCTAVTAVST